MKKNKKWLALLMSAAMVVPVAFAACADGNGGGNETPPAGDTGADWDKDLAETTVYFVGDSTVCSFDDEYYLPRYGYGTQFKNYVSDKVTVKNLALSGRSSYSFTTESNYNTLKTSISDGDYLIIGFGHNDQKDAIYTNPNLTTDSIETINSRPASFKYTLYENYIKLAQDKGATPILCTPIVRADPNDNYSGNSGHNRTQSDGGNNPGGDWSKAIRDLGAEKNVTVIDLTTLTKEDYTNLGFAKAIDYHAFTAGETVNGETQRVNGSVDKTHTNMYGAKMNAYYIADTLKSSTNSLGKYVKPDISKPKYDTDYIGAINTSYKVVPYTPFNPSTSAKSVLGKNITKEGWYGTAFGSIGGNPSTDYFKVEQNGENSFTVGGLTYDGKTKGKITGSEEGIAMAFTQLASNKTFEITAEVTIDEYYNNNQTGFGIMVRDDIYIDTNNAGILSNYAAAGCYGTPTSANILYTRVNTVLTPVNTGKMLNTSTIHTLSVKRDGETVIVTFDDMTKSFPDFELRAKDNGYMYICLYATRGTTVTFNNIVYNVTGESQA